MSLLDWEKQFKGKKSDETFSLNESIFILTIAKFQPIDSKPELRSNLLQNGLSEAEYRDTYDLLKKKQILRFNISAPRGWYVDKQIIDQVKKQNILDDLISEKQRQKKKASKKNNGSTIDSFLHEETDEAKETEKSDKSSTSKDQSDNLGVLDDTDISHDEFLKIVEEWREKNL